MEPCCYRVVWRFDAVCAKHWFTKRKKMFNCVFSAGFLPRSRTSPIPTICSRDSTAVSDWQIVITWRWWRHITSRGHVVSTRCNDIQRQTTVTDYFSSKQLLLFVFARRSVCQYWMAEDNPAAQRQTAVTVICLKTSAVSMMTQYVAAGVATRPPLSARL